jgi:DnaK suppressor protein
MAARKQKTAAESKEKSGDSKSKRSSSSTSARTNDIQPRAHPDAGLTKPQVKKLYQKLIEERDRINARIRQRVGHATEDASPLAEEGDIAQRATEQDYQLRLADKQHKLLDQVLAALNKMEIGEYGVCEGSEEPIGFRRLEIRPWARYSVEYKERMDRRNR